MIIYYFFCIFSRIIKNSKMNNILYIVGEILVFRFNFLCAAAGNTICSKNYNHTFRKKNCLFTSKPGAGCTQTTANVMSIHFINCVVQECGETKPCGIRYKNPPGDRIDTIECSATSNCQYSQHNYLGQALKLSHFDKLSWVPLIIKNVVASQWLDIFCANDSLSAKRRYLQNCELRLSTP